MGFRTFNDRYAVIWLAVLAVLWAGLILGAGHLPDQTVTLIVGPLVGASIGWAGQLISFYFRKAPPTSGNGAT